MDLDHVEDEMPQRYQIAQSLLKHKRPIAHKTVVYTVAEKKGKHSAQVTVEDEMSQLNQMVQSLLKRPIAQNGVAHTVTEKEGKHSAHS